jgi:polysaccharide export outer membrane protein
MNLKPLSICIATLLAVSGTAIAKPTVAAVTVTAPAAAATSSGVKTAAAIPQATPEAAPMDVRLEALGMGDMVRISVFRNPELTTEARVSERVTVSMMQVNSRQVSVLGNVVKPGRYPIDSTSVRVTDFIANAGGISPTGSDSVTILMNRGGKQERIEVDLADMFRRGDLSSNIALEPGDTIYVNKAPMVYVYGEVQKGGAYRVEPHMTVMQAIAMGGGITPRGTERGIKISRRDSQGVRRIDANLTDSIQADDVIYVRESLF